MSDPAVGVDIGGTFTDLVTVTDGTIVVEKTPSTPADPAAGCLEGLGLLGVDALDRFDHGTTVATNAVLEGEWAETALVTTEGCRDVLEIGRQTRPSLYDLFDRKPEPIIPRRRRFELEERLDETGAIESALTDTAIQDVLDHLEAADPEAVAISLLFAFENDTHEVAMAEAISEELDVPVSRSSDVLPEIREYERTLVTALDAALKPVMSDYLATLASRLEGSGYEAPVSVMQSNGGTIPADLARSRPVTTVLSGPAAGVRGAAHVGELAGASDLLTMDMGGTSCDVSLVLDGEPATATDVTVGAYPLSLPMVDVHTIGAGGGSIAWIDDGGALRVGPSSAGADPGPICYGRGGEQPTVADAQYVLGRVPRTVLADSLGRPLESIPDRETVAASLVSSLGASLDGDGIMIAEGMLSVANASMERALRVMSVERGHDPREMPLVAFGGAGPLHAVALARSMDISDVLIPRAAGVLSALGLLASDVVASESMTRIRKWETIDRSWLQSSVDSLVETGINRLDMAIEDLEVDVTLECRYVGQTFTLGIDVPVEISPGDMARIPDAFDEEHELTYGHADQENDLELVTVRVDLTHERSPPSLAIDRPDATLAEAKIDTRAVIFDGSEYETPVYDRGNLPIETRIEGPALIPGDGTTVVLPPSAKATLDRYGTLAMEVSNE